MKKGCIRVLIGAFLFVGALATLTWWVLRQTFGPRYRTVEIAISPDKTLICEETFHAGYGGESYFVTFSLADGDKDVMGLGNTIYSGKKWDTTLLLSEIGDWIVIPVDQYGYSKILLTNIHTGLNKDTIFFPVNLREDSLWKAKYNDVPDAYYIGQSNMESVGKNRFSVNYNYRTGSDDSAPIYNQVCVYEFDSLAGKFVTRKVGDRKPE